jgi:hypothetical protein|eukprot:COSAG02_NODE_421_length_22605_cov_158.841198_5_plen_141_part_00
MDNVSACRMRLFAPQSLRCWADSTALVKPLMAQVKTALVVRGRCDTRVTEYVAREIWCDSETLYSETLYASIVLVFRNGQSKISLPRFQGIGAALQLRAHLNHVADHIDPENLSPGMAIPTSNRMDMDPTRFGTQSMAQM